MHAFAKVGLRLEGILVMNYNSWSLLVLWDVHELLLKLRLICMHIIFVSYLLNINQFNVINLTINFNNHTLQCKRCLLYTSDAADE